MRMNLWSELVCFGNNSWRSEASNSRNCLSQDGEFCGCSGTSHRIVKTERLSGRDLSS